jgi:arylsulfatase A-like enzyme
LVERYQKKVKPGMRHTNVTYAAMVHSLDESVGRILGCLEKHGIADRTIVILTSDNGGFIGKWKEQPVVTNNAPLRSGKGSLYEGGVRVPLMIRWPGKTKANAVCSEPVFLTDTYRTIVEMAGVQQDDGDAEISQDGVSLVPLLKNPAARLDRQALYWHYPHYYETTTPVSSIRAGDWKLLEYLDDNRVELYNLRDDLSETKDLAGQQPAQRDELRSMLHTWRESVDAQMPTPNPDRRK